MPADPEIVRSKLLDIGEAVGRLRSWLPLTVDRLERDERTERPRFYNVWLDR